MKYVFLAFFIMSVASCETDNFDADKRQIMAKDLIRSKLGRNARYYDIVAFREDTLASWPDSFIRKPIQYSVDFVYNDSSGLELKKKGTVLFAPNGRSIINYSIVDR
ncbi:MAG: hypothetical protein NVS1B13_09670 [Flavisolibacter sp.]